MILQYYPILDLNIDRNLYHRFGGNYHSLSLSGLALSESGNFRMLRVLAFYKSGNYLLKLS